MKVRIDQQLKNYLKTEHYSKKELAENIGITTPGLDKILKRETIFPQPLTVRKIQELLGVKVQRDDDGYFVDPDEKSNFNNTDRRASGSDCETCNDIDTEVIDLLRREQVRTIKDLNVFLVRRTQSEIAKIVAILNNSAAIEKLLANGYVDNDSER